MGIISVSKTIWCDVAFAHPEIPVRLKDAHQARREEAQTIVCVVIDVLRATTNIALILENGCSAIYPCASPEAALEAAEKLRLEHGFEKILLGGEQNGKPIEGFDGGIPLWNTRDGESAGKHWCSPRVTAPRRSPPQRIAEKFSPPLS